MSHKNLDLYLKDHLAGAVGALRLCAHIEERIDDRSLAREVASLHERIEEDRATLVELAQRLSVPESKPRNLLAAAGEAIGRVKLRMQGSPQGDLQMLQAFDSLVVGIRGKRALWTALQAACDTNPALHLVDYTRLRERADEQLQEVEHWREAFARRAFVFDADAPEPVSASPLPAAMQRPHTQD